MFHDAHYPQSNFIVVHNVMFTEILLLVDEFHSLKALQENDGKHSTWKVIQMFAWLGTISFKNV